IGRTVKLMGVLRHLLLGEGDTATPRRFAESVAVPYVNRDISLKIWQPEGRLAIAAVGRAEQREERLVLVDRQQLPVTHRPAFRREIETHDPNLGKEWFCHGEFTG